MVMMQTNSSKKTLSASPRPCENDAVNWICTRLADNTAWPKAESTMSAAQSKNRSGLAGVHVHVFLDPWVPRTLFGRRRLAFPFANDRPLRICLEQGTWHTCTASWEQAGSGVH